MVVAGKTHPQLQRDGNEAQSPGTARPRAARRTVATGRHPQVREACWPDLQHCHRGMLASRKLTGYQSTLLAVFKDQLLQLFHSPRSERVSDEICISIVVGVSVITS